MAGMISQAKRQTTSKVVPETPPKFQTLRQKPLKNMDFSFNIRLTIHTPNSRYKKKEENASPSSSFEKDAVVAREERKGLGEQSEPTIAVSEHLARLVKERWVQ